MSPNTPRENMPPSLPQLVIRVDGTGSVFRKAERAYLRLAVASTSTDQSEAFENAQSTVSSLTANIRSLALKTENGGPHPSAAVTAFTVTPLSTTWRYQRDEHNREVRSLPREHTVAASAEIIFRDFTQLAEMTAQLATMPHISVGGTEWRLTDATLEEIEHEARLKAIRNAVEKATDYAEAVGRRVVAVEIKDGPSSDTDGYSSYRPGGRMMQAAQMPQQMYQLPAQYPGGSGMAQAAAGPALEPKTITVSAYVNAKFVSIDGDDDGEVV